MYVFVWESKCYVLYTWNQKRTISVSLYYVCFIRNQKHTVPVPYVLCGIKNVPFQYVMNSVCFMRKQKRTLSVCHKFRMFYAETKTYHFSMSWIPHLFHMFYTQKKRTLSVCHTFRTYSVPIPYLVLNFKKGKFFKPHNKYVNSVFIFLERT